MCADGYPFPIWCTRPYYTEMQNVSVMALTHSKSYSAQSQVMAVGGGGAHLRARTHRRARIDRDEEGGGVFISFSDLFWWSCIGLSWPICKLKVYVCGSGLSRQMDSSNILWLLAMFACEFRVTPYRRFTMGKHLFYDFQ